MRGGARRSPELRPSNPRISLAGRPAHDDVEGIRGRTEPQLVREFRRLKLGDVAGLCVKGRPRRIAIRVKIQGMRCRRLPIHLDRSIDTASRRLKAQRDPAAAGEEIKKPGRRAARQTGQLSLNGRLSRSAAVRAIAGCRPSGSAFHGRRVEIVLECQGSKLQPSMA